MKPTIDPFFLLRFGAKLSKLSACEIVVRLRAYASIAALAIDASVRELAGVSRLGIVKKKRNK